MSGTRQKRPPSSRAPHSPHPQASSGLSLAEALAPTLPEVQGDNSTLPTAGPGLSAGLDLQQFLDRDGGGGPASASVPAPSPVPTVITPAPPLPDPPCAPTQFLEIVLAHGDLTRTRSKLILLAGFQDLPPPDAFHSLDAAMDGALTALSQRLAPGLARGELDVVPTAGFAIAANSIAYLGLGLQRAYAADGSSLMSATEDGLRGLLLCRVEEFATVLAGTCILGEPQLKLELALEYMLAGFCKAIVGDAKHGRYFRRITIAEQDLGRFRQIEQRLQSLITTSSIFRGLLVHYRTETLPQPEHTAPPPKANRIILDPDKKVDAQGTSRPALSLTLLPVNRDAGVPRVDSENYLPSTLQEIFRLTRVADGLHATGAAPAPAGNFTPQHLRRVSELVTSLVPLKIQRIMTRADNASGYLELVNERSTASLPWETLNLGPEGSTTASDYPALRTGISRSFANPHSARVRDTTPRKKGPLQVLIVVNPTGDLPGAEKEGRHLYDTLGKLGEDQVRVRVISGSEATVDNLTRTLNEHQFDILHYAGHSFYQQTEVSTFSGLLLHNKEPFTGNQVMNLESIPSIVVFNSCQAALIHSDIAAATTRSVFTQEERALLAAQGTVTVAEAFLLAGVKHFIGTFWPVQDEAATLFSAELYLQISAHKNIGESIRSARRTLFDKALPDWANYIHYGDQDAHPLSSNGEG